MHKRPKPKPALRITVAWECPACGVQHLWKWKRGDLNGYMNWSIIMRCDTCDAETTAFLTRIGRNAWAGAW